MSPDPKNDINPLTDKPYTYKIIGSQTDGRVTTYTFDMPPAKVTNNPNPSEPKTRIVTYHYSTDGKAIE